VSLNSRILRSQFRLKIDNQCAPSDALAFTCQPFFFRHRSNISKRKYTGPGLSFRNRCRRASSILTCICPQLLVRQQLEQTRAEAMRLFNEQVFESKSVVRQMADDPKLKSSAGDGATAHHQLSGRAGAAVPLLHPQLLPALITHERQSSDPNSRMKGSCHPREIRFPVVHTRQ
jgi:hypothetical protein